MTDRAAKALRARIALPFAREVAEARSGRRRAPRACWS